MTTTHKTKPLYIVHISNGEVLEFDNPIDFINALDFYGPEVIDTLTPEYLVDRDTGDEQPA